MVTMTEIDSIERELYDRYVEAGIWTYLLGDEFNLCPGDLISDNRLASISHSHPKWVGLIISVNETTLTVLWVSYEQR